MLSLLFYRRQRGRGRGRRECRLPVPPERLLLRSRAVAGGGGVAAVVPKVRLVLRGKGEPPPPPPWHTTEPAALCSCKGMSQSRDLTLSCPIRIPPTSCDMPRSVPWPGSVEVLKRVGRVGSTKVSQCDECDEGAGITEVSATSGSQTCRVRSSVNMRCEGRDIQCTDWT